MALNFDLKQRDAIEDAHQIEVYRFNLAKNYALLSGDSSVVRRFYREKAGTLNCGDVYKHAEIDRSFFFRSRPKNAFVYAGLIPWIAESMVRLVASAGFVVNSPLQGNDDFDKALQKDMNNYAKQACKQTKLQDCFESGVYLETGIGDLLFRISYDDEISNKPILDIIEPHNFEVEWKRGHIRSFVIKERSDEVKDGKRSSKLDVEMRETYTKKDGKVKVQYSFHCGGHKITKRDPMYEAAQKHWGIKENEMSFELPFDDFPLIYKQSSKKSMLYRGERGVPDIHGLDTIEDALSECLSHLVDTIRKSSPKTFVDKQLLRTNLKGETFEYDDFDYEYLLLDDVVDPSKLLTTQQAKIDYASHLETAKMLISHAINKVGLSPTTLGVTGLESINSSSESQDAREKPSLRTREIKLKGWKETLEEILNKYFQYVAYLNKEEIRDYSDLISISFNEYINPSTENIVSVISQAVAGRVYSIELGVEKQFIADKKDYTLDDIIAESARIRGIKPEEEMVLLGLSEETPEQSTDLPEGSQDTAANQNKEPTGALKEENKDGGRNTTTDTNTSGDTATNDGADSDK